MQNAVFRIVMLAVVAAAAPALATPSQGSGGAVPPPRDFPCKGCSVQLPDGYDPKLPAPLLVALHGSGNTSNKFWAAAKAAGYIELAPACPVDDGCTKLDWNWPNGSIDWVLRQIDAVAAKYDVELSRVYLVGQSAGAFFIARNADELKGRVAGIGLVSGGSAPAMCPDCKFPVYLLYGTADTISRNVPAAGAAFQKCGHETIVDALEGYDHLGAIYALSGKEQKAAAILKFFDGHRPTGCPATAAAAGGAAGMTGAAMPDAGAPAAGAAGVAGVAGVAGAATVGGAMGGSAPTAGSAGTATTGAPGAASGTAGQGGANDPRPPVAGAEGASMSDDHGGCAYGGRSRAGAALWMAGLVAVARAARRRRREP